MDRRSSDARVPPFQQVADQLRMEILDGRRRVGDRFPTQHELVERFKVSRATIQRALAELHEEGYIDSHQGRGTFVADWRKRDHGNGSTAYRPGNSMTVLPAAVEAAFESDVVTLDAYSFTGETLYNALITPLARIRTEQLRPKKIKVRLLLPSIDAHLAIPRNSDDPSDERPLRRLRKLTSNHSFNIANALRDLQFGGYVDEVEAEIREVPITPMFKLYILNGTEALWGYYRIVPDREVEIEGAPVRVVDVLGLGSVLFRYTNAEADSPDAQFVAQSVRWFESLWSTIAKESTLSK